MKSRFPRHAKWGAFLLLGMVLVALFAPLIIKTDPTQFNPNLIGTPTPPSLAHWFGTDDLGRDLFARSLYGAKISLSVGVVSVGISVLIGLILGVLTGYLGGIFDRIMMRLVDIFLAIPTLFLILIIQALLTPSLWNVMVVIGLTSWMGVCRMVRAETLSLKERPFILAAKSRGIRPFRLVFKHLLPHTLAPVSVSLMLGMGSAILTESMLSFLGLGVQPPHPSWGNMLQDSLAYMTDAPWMMIVPGVLITLTVLALNLAGDGLRVLFERR